MLNSLQYVHIGTMLNSPKLQSLVLKSVLEQAIIPLRPPHLLIMNMNQEIQSHPLRVTV